MRVAAFQAPLLPCGSAEAIGLIRNRVDWCEAEGVEILCCPEAVLGGLADDAAHPVDIAIDVEGGQLQAVLTPLASSTVTTIVGFTEITATGHSMSISARPHIDCEQHHATLSVSDVRGAADFYAKKLGFILAFTEGDPPTFAGVNLGHVQIFLTKGTPAPHGCSVYFVVGDADALYEFHRANGVEIVEAPRDQPYGLREYTVRDQDGYYLNFGHRLRRATACG